MSEAMSLEEYKKKVEECLNKNYRHTEARTKSLMEHYEESFPDIMKEKLTQAEDAVGMVMNLL